MKFDGFIGPTYTPSSYAVDQQRTINWYTEKNEANRSKNPMAAYGPYSLLRTPGRKLFCNTGFPGSRVRASYSLNGHSYYVVGQTVIEVLANGTSIQYGNVVDDGLPASIAGNETQLFIVSGGNGYILSGTLNKITSPGFPTGQAVGAAMADQYFFTAIKGTNFYQVSALGDGTTWDASFKSAKEASPDNIAMIGALGSEFWPFGNTTVEVMDDTGNLYTPYAPEQNVVITRGIYAPYSLQNVGGSWCYISQTSTGGYMVMRISAYTPTRISDHSVEAIMTDIAKTSGTASDAIGSTYEENGHIFYVLYFPTGDRTLVYDLSTGQWHERTWMDPGTALEHASRSITATFCFDKILVGDRIDGNIYEQSMAYLDDGNSQLIRRTRQAPVIKQDLMDIVHSNFVLDGNMGLGLDGVSPGDPDYDPQAMLKWSNDGGKTWGNEHWRGFGSIGDYKRRAVWRSLGYARRRVYQLQVTAPVDWAFNSCSINMRLAKQGRA